MLKEQGYPIILDTFLRCEEPMMEEFDIKKNRDPIEEMDANIEEKINHAIWKNDVLRVTDIHEIEIHVHNGVVFISGHVLSSTNRQRIEKAIQTVKGIFAIRSNLVMDDDLTREIAGSLAQLEHKHNCKFFTGVSHGVVKLGGEVISEEVRKSAEVCAANNSRVRGVINNIRVIGTEMEPQDSRLLQPAIGKEMYFRDGVFGIVRQVVIDPDNRRVISMILQGHFNNLHQGMGSSNLTTIQLAEQKRVIPMSVMGYLTINSGSLAISSTEVISGKYKFDPALFVAPHKAWVPPFPYCLQDVLFPVRNQQLIGDTTILMPPVSKKEEQKLSEELNANDSLGG